MEIISNIKEGTIKIYEKFEEASRPSLDEIGDEFAISFPGITKITNLLTFKYDTIGLTSTRYLENYYRISIDNTSWTEWYPLNKDITNFPSIEPNYSIFLEIKWVRIGTETSSSIELLEYEINGTIEREIYEGSGEEGGTVYTIAPGETVILKAPYIYKVFKITDIEILSTTSTDDLYIEYRISQDNSRSWSEWEIFTLENITSVRINPVRFFQIEYSITNNSSTSNAGLMDINLIGDFQNVSQDYFKTNLFGVRVCPLTQLDGIMNCNGEMIPTDNVSGISSTTGACDTTGAGTSLPQTTEQDAANLFQPYQQSEAQNLLSKLSSDAELIFGHSVLYFLTDPDKNGQDHTIHEYQLHNVVCKAIMKVAVDNNQFPDSQIKMNVFDLSLFESMTIHITKHIFKEAFGPQRRPSKEDFIYFSNLNRMFQVEHAQAFRGFNNMATYYKIILKKYNQKSNIHIDDSEIKDKLRNLTKNTTLGELMGPEKDQDKAAIANKQQITPLTTDPIRLDYFVKIVKELIENSSTIISKSYYELSSIDSGEDAVIYKNLDPIVKKSDNLSYMAWFRLKDYASNEKYNFLNYYDDVNSFGIKINIEENKIIINLNGDEYTDDISQNNNLFYDDVWYLYIVNIDQRKRVLSNYIYKRNVEYEEDASKLSSTILKQLHKNTQSMNIIEYHLDNSINCKILSSNMDITNIRMFIDVIPENYHTKLGNQYIIGDNSKYLIFADNATNRIFLPKFPLFE
jgi:hypothetical protein